MNKRLQGAIAGALAVAVVGGASVFAKDAAESITAVYRNIKLVVDGVQIEPKDANGNVVEPFIYNGTTYLPVRAVATAFNKEVSWDGDNAVVYLGGEVEKPAKEMPMWNRSYLEVGDANYIRTYEKNGVGYIYYDARGGGEKVADGRWVRHNTIKYPLNALAKSVSGKFYLANSTKGEGVLRIYDSNGKTIYESPIMRESTAPVEFNVNVENEVAITFDFEYENANTTANIYIENPTVVTADY